VSFDFARIDHDDVSTLRISGTLDGATASQLGATVDKLLPVI
jgi:hypothetical protein